MMHAEPSRVLPIVFSGEMVRALLAGRKVVTRRLATSPLARLGVGDLLWVREAVEIVKRSGGPDALLVCRYMADGAERRVASRRQAAPRNLYSPRFMPRELSRLTLRVLSVDEARLQWVGEGDAVDEGIEAPPGEARAAFAALWDHLRDRPGERWADNPEVCVIRFAVLRRPVDALLPGLGHGGVR
jgi:hypothetical protein